MSVLRRRSLLNGTKALLAAGLVAAGIAMVSHLDYHKAGFTGCGYGYAGYGYGYGGYGYGYGNCTTPSDTFAQGDVFVVQPGQTLPLSGSTGVGGANGQIQVDAEGTTVAAAKAASTPQT